MCVKALYISRLILLYISGTSAYWTVTYTTVFSHQNLCDYLYSLIINSHFLYQSPAGEVLDDIFHMIGRKIRTQGIAQVNKPEEGPHNEDRVSISLVQYCISNIQSV